MKLKRSLLFTLALVVIAAIIHFYSNDSTRVENQYSNGIYPAFGRFLRYLFGWLPFSIGDVLYGLIIIWVIWKVIRSLKALAPLNFVRSFSKTPLGRRKENIFVKIKRKVSKQSLVAGFFKTFRILLIVYIVFNAFWGINYNRVGIAEQLQLKMNKYSLENLKMINGLLVEKVNTSKQSLVIGHINYPTNKQLFSKVQGVYQQAEGVYPFLKYQPVSLKPSLWSWVGNYMGFTGYYNPFTGEAQVNTLVPKFLQPFTTCHEVAHQLGYAKEMEANFVAYLAATASQDTLLHYSVYLDLFMYSNRNLFMSDSVAARAFGKQLSPYVQADLKEWKTFNIKHRNPVEPVFRWIYGIYLKQNQQPQGVLSYDEVTGFIIAWYKKYGKI